MSRIEVAYGGNGRFAPTCVRFPAPSSAARSPSRTTPTTTWRCAFWRGAERAVIPTKSGLHTDLVARQEFSPAYRAAHGLPDKKLIVMPDPFDGDGVTDGGDVVLFPPSLPT